jgi:hypothetical protein
MQNVQEASPTVPGEPRFEYGGEQPENKDASCKSMEELAMAVAHLIRRQAAAWITDVHEDPACDYLETRTGSEVRPQPSYACDSM